MGLTNQITISLYHVTPDLCEFYCLASLALVKAEESDASSCSSSNTIYYEMSEKPDTQGKSYDPVLASASEGPMDISHKMLDSLAVFADDMAAHLQKETSFSEFPRMSGEVLDCSLGTPMEQQPSTSGVAAVRTAAASAAAELLPPGQTSHDARGMDVDSESGGASDGDQPADNPRGRELAECFVNLSPLAKQILESPVIIDKFTTERSMGAPYPHDTSPAATALVEGKPMHLYTKRLPAPSAVLKGDKPLHYGVMEAHRQFVYPDNGKTPLRWTALGCLLEYEVACCNRDIFEKFAVPLKPEDHAITIEDAFVNDTQLKVCDPTTSTGKHVGYNVDFIQYQCCPVINCRCGPSDKLPVTAQKSLFANAQNMLQHFKEVHVHCQLRT